MTGIGGHQSPTMGSDIWLTPPEILYALGPFDLDPCAPPERPWDMAAQHYSLPDDGLSMAWHGRVWLNPPYSRDIGPWMARLAHHGEGTALVFARTETQWFQDYVWPVASSVLFIAGRLHFHHPDGRRADFNGGAPSVLISYGDEDRARLAASGIAGQIVRWPKTPIVPSMQHSMAL